MGRTEALPHYLCLGGKPKYFDGTSSLDNRDIGVSFTKLSSESPGVLVYVDVPMSELLDLIYYFQEVHPHAIQAAEKHRKVKSSADIIKLLEED